MRTNTRIWGLMLGAVVVAGGFLAIQAPGSDRQPRPRAVAPAVGRAPSAEVRPSRPADRQNRQPLSEFGLAPRDPMILYKSPLVPLPDRSTIQDLENRLRGRGADGPRR